VSVNMQGGLAKNHSILTNRHRNIQVYESFTLDINFNNGTSPN